MTIERPVAGEYPPGMAGYVGLIAGPIEPLAAIESQRDQMLALLAGIDEQGARSRYAPGKWSIKQCVGHLTDAERVFAYRLLRFARGDETPLPGFDEGRFMTGATFDDLDYAQLVRDWSAVREATLTLITTVADAAWQRSGQASGHPCSARALLYVILGHTDHHFAVLTDRYGVRAR